MEDEFGGAAEVEEPLPAGSDAVSDPPPHPATATAAKRAASFEFTISFSLARPEHRGRNQGECLPPEPNSKSLASEKSRQNSFPQTPCA